MDGLSIVNIVKEMGEYEWVDDIVDIFGCGGEIGSKVLMMFELMFNSSNVRCED